MMSKNEAIKPKPDHLDEGETQIPLAGVNPSKEEISAELRKLSGTYQVPHRALMALIGAESDFRQFEGGRPLVNKAKTSSAAGLGQITRRTAEKHYKESYERVLHDWRFNLDLAARIYRDLYHHPWIRREQDREKRAARAYGLYHDGFPKEKRPMYRDNKGYTGTSYEFRYRRKYGKFH